MEDFWWYVMMGKESPWKNRRSKQKVCFVASCYVNIKQRQQLGRWAVLTYQYNERIKPLAWRGIISLSRFICEKELVWKSVFMEIRKIKLWEEEVTAWRIWGREVWEYRRLSSIDLQMMNWKLQKELPFSSVVSAQNAKPQKWHMMDCW